MPATSRRDVLVLTAGTALSLQASARVEAKPFCIKPSADYL
jgi:hypothetical protein